MEGAGACLQAGGEATRCTTVPGVSVDDTTRRFTIHLTEPDPYFLAKLALAIVPAPAGSPMTEVARRAAIPGTGPYLISEVGADGSYTLSRNPAFHQWSFAAQPYGYPDQIRYQVAPSEEQAVADVLAGRADVLPVGSRQLPALAGHAELVQQYPNFNTDWAYLNSTLPPFDNVKARRALNFAVDRSRFVELYGGGPHAADASCQMLPAGFPGYRPYCPYQTGAPHGPYLGPDLERARRLVQESGTAAVPITVHAFHGYSLWDAFPPYLAEVLRAIGYQQVTVQDIPLGPNRAQYHSFQIFTQQGWLPDYQSPQTFYNMFSCDSEDNFSDYCNPEIDKVASQASALAVSDSARSLALWTQVDQMLTDDAAFVTLGSHHDAVLVSPRLRNLTMRAVLGPILSQIWVK